MVIYKITNLINNKIYIGQTINFKIRMNQHKNAHKYKNCSSPIDRAIGKYGHTNFSYEIIEYAKSLEDLNELEVKYIKIYNSLIGNDGYNLKSGGNGGKHHEVTKRKIGAAQLGELNHAYGKSGALSATSKRVIDVDTGIIYDNATICAETLKLGVSKVCAVCRGVRGSTGGKVFRYVDNLDNPIIPNNAVQNIDKRVKVRCIETGEIFDTIASAGKKFNLVASNLGLILRTGQKDKTFGGYHWEYIK